MTIRPSPLSSNLAILASTSAVSRRTLSTSSPALLRPPPRRPADKPPTNPLDARDHQIPFSHVSLVSPETNALSAPQPLRSILSTYDTATHTLILVSLDPPIVKLLNKEDEKRKVREKESKEKMRRKIAFEEKEVQVSWASAPGDLAHKVTLVKNMLERGDRVQLVFAPRAGNAGKNDNISEKRKKEMVDTFDEAMVDVGVKWKPDEVSKGMWVVFWSAVEGVRSDVRKKAVEGEVEKRREKDEKKEARRRKEAERLAKARGEAA